MGDCKSYPYLGSIFTWEDLATRFLAQFFLPGRTAKLHNDILMFQQHHGASLSEAYVPSTSDRRLIELENQVQLLMEALLALTQPAQVNKVTTPCEICSGPHDTQYCMEDPEQAFVEYASSRTDEAGEGLVSEFMASQDARLSKFEADFKRQQGEMTNKIDTVLKAITDQIMGTLPSDTVKNPKLGRGFLAIANAVIDCRMVKIAVGEGITSSDGIGIKPPYYARKDFFDFHLPGEWEISRDVELNPFKDTLVFRRMVEFLGAIPINLKCNMWESDDLIKKPINWDKPPKNGDGAWHAKIRLIDPDGEEFTKTLQSIPTTRKLSERESPREIIDLDHFYDT
ncbi:MAK10-like protein [Tanacetum coccineum]